MAVNNTISIGVPAFPSPVTRVALEAWLTAVGLGRLGRASTRSFLIEMGLYSRLNLNYWVVEQDIVTVLANRYGVTATQIRLLQEALVDAAKRVLEAVNVLDLRLAAAIPLLTGEVAEATTALLAERDALRAAGVREARALDGELDPLTLVLTARLTGCMGASTTVAVKLEPSATGPRSACSCLAPRAACSERLAMVNGALDALVLREDPRGHDVREAVKAPRWQRALQSMDRAIGVVVDPVANLAWALDPHSQRLEPVCADRSGRKLKVTLWPTESLQRSVAGSANARDRQLLERWTGRGRATNMASVLPLLDGHPEVYLWPEKTPIRVVCRELKLDLREEAGGMRIVPLLGDNTPLDGLAGATISTFRSEEVAWWVSPIGVEYTRINPRLRSLLTALSEFGGLLPREALPGLVDRLPRLAAVAPVRTDALPGMQDVAPQPLPVVIVEALPQGALSVSVRVRPLGAGPLFIAGDGPTQVIATVGNGVRSTRRDFAAELGGQAAAAEALGLDDVDVTPDRVIEDPFEALELVDRLQRASGLLTVQWRQKPVQIASSFRADNLRVTVSSAGRWFQLAGNAVADGNTVPIGALLEAARLGRSFVAVGDGQWARIEDGLRRQLSVLARNAHAAAGAPRTQQATQVSGIHAALVEELSALGATIEGDARWREGLARIEEARGLDPQVPAELTATLRPYQIDGFRWMARLAHWAGGAVLADDMGLGKTLQALAMLVYRAKEGPALVIAPTSLGSNWMREAAAFAPTLRLRLHRGTGRDKTLGALGPGDVVVTSYDIAVIDRESWKHTFATVVFDEAHALKNSTTLRARAAVEIPAACRIALSGTPIENRVGELWSLFRAVLPGVFGSAEHFRDRWVGPIERDGDADARTALARLVRPFILRRTKAEVARELPPRTEVRIDVELGVDARARYDEMRTAMARALAGLDEHTRPEQRRFQVLIALTRLRQIACHPGLLDPTWTGGSPKLTAMVDLLLELKEEGRRALVFSQFTEHLRLAGEAMTAAGISFRYLDGSTPATQRDAEVAAFMGGQGDVFLLSVKAGGVGLNLTAASDVVILDPWWNPAVENQAADRAHRIGQTQAVTIYRLVAQNTVEEQMLRLHAEKQELVSAVLEGTGEGASLSVEDMLALLES